MTLIGFKQSRMQSTIVFAVATRAPETRLQHKDICAVSVGHARVSGYNAWPAVFLKTDFNEQTRYATAKGNSTGGGTAFRRAAGAWFCEGAFPRSFRRRLGDALPADAGSATKRIG